MIFTCYRHLLARVPDLIWRQRLTLPEQRFVASDVEEKVDRCLLLFELALGVPTEFDPRVRLFIENFALLCEAKHDAEVTRRAALQVEVTLMVGKCTNPDQLAHIALNGASVYEWMLDQAFLHLLDDRGRVLGANGCRLVRVSCRRVGASGCRLVRTSCRFLVPLRAI